MHGQGVDPPVSAHFSGATATVGSSFTPFGMAVDSAGDVFVADQGNSAVKEIVAVNGSISSSSTVITIGSGFYYPAAVAVDSAGDVFVADALHNAVKEIVAVNRSVSSSSTVNTIGSGFNDPYAVAVDSAGNVFVADYGNNAMKEIVAVNGAVSSSSTVLTIGSGFYEPYGVAVDSAGDVFVGQQAFGAQQVATAVKEIVAVNGAVSSSSTVISAGSGFYGAGSMAVDSVGDVFVEDTGHGYLKEIVAVNGSVSSSSTVLTVARATSCYGVALDSSGHIFYGAYNAVKEYMTGGSNFGSLPVATSTPETISLTFIFDSNGVISAPAVLTQGATGLDFTDAGTGTCTTNGTSYTYNMGDTCTVDVKFKPTRSGVRYGAATLSSLGSTIATGYLHGTGVAPQVAFPPGTTSTIGSGFSGPSDVAVDSAGDVFVADFSNNAVKEIVAVSGAVTSSSTVNTVGSGFTQPLSVAVDGAGDVFVADFGNNAVKKIVAVNGAVSSSSTVNTIGSGFSAPQGVAVDGAGNVFVADSSNSAVKELIANQGAVSSSSTVNTIGSGFSGPTGVAVDSSGDVFVADAGNNEVKEIVAVNGVVSSSSTVNTVGSGFSNPYRVSVDSAGDVFVADYAHNAVKEIVAASGAVSSSSTVNAIGGYFSGPAGVAVDSAGNVFVASPNNNAVSKIDVADPPSLSFATTMAGSTSSDSPQTVTVTNSGNAALTFEVPSTGLNPSISASFTFGNSSTCPQLSTGSSVQTLAAGASCTELISFAPATAGSKTGSLVMTDNALNAAGPTYIAQTISLSGTATPPGPSATQAVASTALTQNHAATAFTPVTGSGGTAPLAYSVSPTLPAGLSFSSSTGAVSGTPTAVSAATTYTVTVTDANSATATATFSLTVNTAVAASTATASTVLTQNHAATAFTPVTGSGGTAPLTYSVSPTLPAGLSISSSTGAVTGTPTATSSATTYTVTITDANGATMTATFSLTVNIAVSASTVIASTVLTQSHAASAFMPVTGSGGTAPLSYSVSPTLPAGLSLSSSTGAVSGTPTGVSSATTYTVTVTDANGATATATFSLTVNTAVSASTVIASTALTQNHAASAFTPVTGSGGTGSLTYNVSPALPVGLSFSSSTGAVSGTPTASSAATTYTVTVTDANGATATATFSLTVNIAVSASTAIASTALTQNHAAIDFTPVAGSGGTAPLTYSVSPTLPAGLSFSSSGVVSGTPTTVSVATTYTVTVTDANSETATATFSLTINIAVSASTSVASTLLTQGHAATSFMPVAGSGGTAPLSYSVLPTLPAGLSFSSAGVVSGAPAGISVATTYTVTVTDANGATATATFSLTIDAITSTAITSSSLTPTYGMAVVLTATVTPAPTDTPPGTVRFYVGSTLLSSAAVNSSGVAMLSAALPLGPDMVTAVYSGSANYAGSSSSGILISDRTVTAVTFSASPTTQLYSNPIVLTAQATSSTAGTLTGMVSFLDGTTVIATVPLGANGQATYSATTLADGSHTLSAAYSGDSNYQPAVSAAEPVAITVNDVGLSVAAGPSQPVVPGAAVAYTLQLASLITPTFLYDVHLTATGLPPGATYTFSPATIPAGSASVPVTFTVQTARGAASLSAPSGKGPQHSSRAFTALAFGLLLPLLGAKSIRKRLKAMPGPLAVLFAVLGAGLLAGLSGCGGGGFYGPTSTSGSYTITVTATSANLVRTSTVQLTIR